MCMESLRSQSVSQKHNVSQKRVSNKNTVLVIDGRLSVSLEYQAVNSKFTCSKGLNCTHSAQLFPSPQAEQPAHHNTIIFSDSFPN